MTLPDGVKVILFKCSLRWDRFHVRYLAPSHRWWAYLLDMDDPEKATRGQVEARARALASLVGKSREEIERDLVNATFTAQMRRLEAEQARDRERIQRGLAAYRDTLRAKGKVGPEESST